MRAFLVAIVLVGCSDNKNSAIDASVPIDVAIPLDAPPDAPPLPDCPTYCAQIQQNCTGTNAQYADATACMSACESFAVGTSTVADRSGNTLGCRTFYAGTPSMTDPVANCPHAGPAGDVISSASGVCSGGDICTSFCTLEIKASGSVEAPLPGDPEDSSGNTLNYYGNVAQCISSCSSFDKTHPYSTTAVVDSLACRLNEAVRAAVSVMPDGALHCSSTQAIPFKACAGVATP